VATRLQPWGKVNESKFALVEYTDKGVGNKNARGVIEITLRARLGIQHLFVDGVVNAHCRRVGVVQDERKPALAIGAEGSFLVKVGIVLHVGPTV